MGLVLRNSLQSTDRHSIWSPRKPKLSRLFLSFQMIELEESKPRAFGFHSFKNVEECSIWSKRWLWNQLVLAIPLLLPSLFFMVPHTRFSTHMPALRYECIYMHKHLHDVHTQSPFEKRLGTVKHDLIFFSITHTNEKLMKVYTQTLSVWPLCPTTPCDSTLQL